jgi:hypothetical protein
MGELKPRRATKPDLQWYICNSTYGIRVGPRNRTIWYRLNPSRTVHLGIFLRVQQLRKCVFHRQFKRPPFNSQVLFNPTKKSASDKYDNESIVQIDSQRG